MSHHRPKIKNWLRNTLVAGAALALLGIGVITARAAGPDVMITWHASSYVPAGFSGKAFPTGGSSITAAVDLIDGGKLADLSGVRILWYANDEQLTSGRGATRAFFTAPVVAPNTINLRVQIEGYRGSSFVKTVSIPVVRPEIALRAFATTSTSVLFEARPLFFSIKKPIDLLFTWMVNGQRTDNSEAPATLLLTVPSSGARQNISVSLKVVNPLSFRESASTEKTISRP